MMRGEGGAFGDEAAGLRHAFALPPTVLHSCALHPLLWPQAKPFTLWRAVVEALAAGMLVRVAHRGANGKRWAAVWDQQLARTACWLSRHDRQGPFASGCMRLSCSEARGAANASAPRCMSAR